MIHFDKDELQRRLNFESLIDRMTETMRLAPGTPVRQRLADTSGREFLTMPAILGEYAGIKSLAIVPENRSTLRPVISGLFTLFSLATGEVLATMDAAELTARRTSAVSAVAANQLARIDAAHLLVLGSGHLAPHLIAALSRMREFQSIRLWARDPSRARQAAAKAGDLMIRSASPPITVVSDLKEAVQTSDVISSATSATAPLIYGEWLRAGTHIDLVGSYRPDMREIDDAGVTCARLFVDDKPAALCEAGDLVDPISRGVLPVDAIAGDLSELCARTAARKSDKEITVFKAVGTAIADLIVAIAAWEACRPRYE